MKLFPCKYCGNPLAENQSRYNCDHCGAVIEHELPFNICRHCGTQNIYEENCPNCGAKVVENTTEITVASGTAGYFISGELIKIGDTLHRVTKAFGSAITVTDRFHAAIDFAF